MDPVKPISRRRVYGLLIRCLLGLLVIWMAIPLDVLLLNSACFPVGVLLLIAIFAFFVEIILYVTRTLMKR